MPGIFGAFMSQEKVLPTASINGEDPNTNTNSITVKSRRKKRKKKKKKKKSVSGESPVVRSDNGDGSSDDDDDNDMIFGMNLGKHGDTTNNSNTDADKDSVKNNKISTPQEILRHRLTETEGFEPSLVDQAMEEMWDKGLLYDKYESVINYLQSGSLGVCGTTASTSSDSVISSNVSTSADAEEGNDEAVVEIAAVDVAVDVAVDIAVAVAVDDTAAVATQTFVPLQNGAALVHLETKTITTTTANEEKTAAVMETVDRDIVHSQNENNNNENDEEKEEDDRNDGGSIGSSNNRAPTPEDSIATKLDVVAEVENLTDAIFALTKWVNEAATDEQIEIFCRAEKTAALPLVVRRGISSEIDDDQRYESAVQPALVGLLMAVLSRCGFDSFTDNSAEAEIVERMENALRQARTISLLATDERSVDIDNDTVISDRVSKFIVSYLTKAMDEIKEHKENENHNYQNGSLDLGDDNDATMAALLSERDAIRADAKRACASVKVSMDSLFSDGTTNGISSNGGTNGHSGPLQSTTLLETSNVLLRIVDQDTKNRFDDERARLEALKTQVVPEGEQSETVKSLRGSLLSLETKRVGYKEKIAELRAALLELESQDEEAALQIGSLSTQISEVERSDGAKAIQLEQEISEAKDRVRCGNLVRTLAGMMKTYVKSIEKATASITGKTITDDVTQEWDEKKNANNTTTEVITGVSASSTMEDYLFKIQKYFLKEAHCATQLRRRLALTKAQETALRSELSQYKSLGAMPTTVATIEGSVAEMQRTILADTHRIATLTNDGRFMYDELLARLETYRSNTIDDKIGGDGVSATGSVPLVSLIPTDLLRGVPAAIKTLDIGKDFNGLLPFVKEPTAQDSSSTDTEAEKTTEFGVPPSSLLIRDPVVAADVALAGPAPTPPPKLSWANPRAKQGLPPVKKHSLLDIQKEEELLNRS